MEIFIGSSKESVQLAHNIASILEKEGCCTKVWDESLFVPSTFTLENLERIAKEVDAAVFVFASDDKLWYRGNEFFTVRDNVLFEAGLFMGSLGITNVCICTSGEIKISTDLHGFITITCDKDSNNLTAELRLWLNNLKSSLQIKMFSRSYVDNHPTLEQRWKYAKEVIIVNYAATSFISSNLIASESVYSHKIEDLFERKIHEGTNFKFLLTSPGSYADYDAATYKMCVVANSNVNARDAITTAAKVIREKSRKYEAEKGVIEYKFTDIALPYAGMLVINDEKYSYMDHVKIDIYSPLLLNDRNRRSFIVYKSNKENYDFFCDNISKMWAEGQKYISYKPHVFNDITADRYEHFKCGNIECKFEVYDEEIGFDNNVDIYFSCFFIIIAGEMDVTLKKEKRNTLIHLKTGDAIVIPRQTYYSLKIQSKTRLLKIVSQY